MTYRRDAQRDDNASVPLPIETVYNSEVDALTEPNNDRFKLDFLHNGHYNRIYFKYPPEWKTSNVGEKIIGVRKMLIRHTDYELKFMLFIRKYNRILIPPIGGVTDESIQESINEICPKLENPSMFVRVFAIPINIHVTNDDTWIDIKERIMNIIRQYDLYHYLYSKLIEKFSLPDTLAPKLQRLELIKADYNAMLLASNDLIGERLTFWLESDKDIEISKISYGTYQCVRFSIPLRNLNDAYRTDYLIMNHNAIINTNRIYGSLFKIDEHGNLTGISVDNPPSMDTDQYRHFPYTEMFFNITFNGFGDGANTMDYLDKYHRRLEFKNVMFNDCYITASFASQSNRNLIGRTNETFTPIKYFKVNDEDDTFWIEFYDRDNIGAPVTINGTIVFTMDVVLLQNRKLLYT